MLSKQGNLAAGPDGLLCLRAHRLPSSLFRHSRRLSNSEARRVQGTLTFCTGGDLRASGHVALLLLLLRPSASPFIPCSSWAMEPLGGAAHCSSICFLQLRPVGSRGGAGAALGSRACTASVLFPVSVCPGALSRGCSPPQLKA